MSPKRRSPTCGISSTRRKASASSSRCGARYALPLIPPTCVCPQLPNLQRVHKQLANAQVKLERAQQNAEEKRAQSQQTLERLQEEYEKMVVDRQVNDRKVEELRAEGKIADGDVSFLFVVGEEKGGPGMIAANDMGLTWEAGIFAEPTEGKLGKGHKGNLVFEIVAHGKAW